MNVRMDDHSGKIKTATRKVDNSLRSMTDLVIRLDWFAFDIKCR